MFYWDHLQYLWWNDTVYDWRTPDQARTDLTGDDRVSIDPALYAKVINIYRAHGEIIIAAMSSSTPKIQFPPDDADNPDDILCAKSKTKLAELIQRHNYADLLMTKALFLLYNQGLVCAYNETMESEEYGTIDREITEEVPKTRRDYFCPDCGMALGSEQLDSNLPPDPETGMVGDNQEEDPEETIVPEGGEELESSPQIVQPANIPIQEGICPNCSGKSGTEVRVPLEFEDYDELASETTGWEKENKCRQILTFWGPLNVKLPAWIRRLNDSPYLILETEEHYAKMQSIYEEIQEHIEPSGNPEYSDRTHRATPAYSGDFPRDLVTVRRCWLRPWAFNTLGVKTEDNKARVQVLKDKFPKGCYVVIINDGIIAEAVDDKLDDHWTCTVHPLSDVLHAEPIGAPVMPVQDMTNELGNLTLENIEHAIPEVYINSDTIDWDNYEKSEARPGMNYPATKMPGEPMGNNFHEVKGGTLSKEVESFADRLEKFAQFVVGSLPSVFGGQIDGGSNTAKEYEMSRTQALQRLSTTWKMVTTFWVQVIGKAVNAHSDYLMESGQDERWTTQSGNTFVNVWVEHAKLTGKIGDAYAEGSESLPVSWNEKRSAILGLIQMQNPMIESVMSDPQNSSLVARLVGLPEMHIPGDQDRVKQLWEISKLIAEEPIEIPNGVPTAMGEEGSDVMPSIQIDPLLDDHKIEGDTCAYWLKSDIGLDYKINKPGAWLNVYSHFKMHREAEAMLAPAPEESGEETSDESEVEEIGA